MGRSHNEVASHTTTEPFIFYRSACDFAAGVQSSLGFRGGIYDEIDEDTIRVVTAYEVPEPWE
jgi:hypothetical protein